METAASYTDGGGADSSQTQQAAAESTNTQDAGTVSQESTQAAESGVTEGQEQTETTTEGTDPAPDKKTHQKTLEERAEEIADRKIQQRLQEQEARRQAETAAKPDYVPVDYDAYDNHIAKLVSAEYEIQNELTLDPENPAALIRQLRQIQQERLTLEGAFTENEKKRTAWDERNKSTEQSQAQQAQIQAEIRQAAVDIPKARGISPEVLQAGQKFITESFAKDPALEQKFNAIIAHKTMYQGFSGVNAAVDWAVTYAMENMGKAAEQARQHRENGKELNPGSAGTTASGSFGNVSTFTELMKLPGAQINQFAKEHPQKFENMKKAHFK